MLKVGLTGGIGSGKSTIAKIFEVLGVPVYYADAATKRLYETNTDLMQQLKQHFGDDIYTGSVLNRARLAAAVFGDEAKLALLNSLAHPPTIADARVWVNAQTAPYIIKEAALLFESGSAADLDVVIGVATPLPMRLQRVMERDGLSAEQVEARIYRQLDETIKMRLCDFVIDNSETKPVLPQVLALHQHLLQQAGA